MKNILITGALILFAIAGAAVYGIIEYLSEVPVITSKGTVTAEAGTMLSVNDIADIEKARSFSLTIDDWQPSDGSNETNAFVSDDCHSVFVGDDPGTFNIHINATGENSESRSDTVKVEVYKSDN